jgi:hypothetical protein
MATLNYKKREPKKRADDTALYYDIAVILSRGAQF